MDKGYIINVLDHGYVRYLDHMGTDKTITDAARISYKSEAKTPEDDRKLLHYLWKNKHTSPFEMIKVVFNVKLPIFVMRQYVRHRMQNLNEVSARYKQLPNEFYIPTVWRRQDTINKQGSVATDLFISEEGGMTYTGRELGEQLKYYCSEAYGHYERLLEFGVAREMARMVLPVNIYTEIVSCWDMKNLLHFIALREDSHAQAEIQEYGRAMKTICQELFPLTMEAYELFKWELKKEMKVLHEEPEKVHAIAIRCCGCHMVYHATSAMCPRCGNSAGSVQEGVSA